MRKTYKKAVMLVLTMVIGIMSLCQAAFAGDVCTVTQYNDASGKQGMFYLIKNGDEIIVVDGGWGDNELQVRSVLKEYGNHVNAWILTHPHPDHIGAFNAVWQKPEGIEIDAVYTIDMDYDRYQELAREWDEFPVYDTFVNIAGKDEKVHYVHTGDEMDICGLHIKVLNAYSEETLQLSKDLANDGSMMFKVTNKKESMLFCADVGKKMGKQIRKMYADDLSCDYIQMGHHGNGGLGKKFYSLTKPKAAFFDAPEWLMHPEDENTNYTTPENTQQMEEMGAEIYYYKTTPNQIELR